MSLANESKPGVSAAIVDLLRTQGTLTTPSLDVQVIFRVYLKTGNMTNGEGFSA